MYSTVRLYIKTGILFLAIGVVLGVYMLVRRELFGVWPGPYLGSAHAHSLTAGFMMFLILGVALWLFPRADREDHRYRPARILAAYWILLTATLARVGGEVAKTWTASPVVAWLVVLGGIGQAAGLLLYFWTMWGRIRPVGSHLREARGERF